MILAAGRGVRLGALTTNRPKCLLPLGSETVLERQLRLLSEVGVDDVVVVVGYRAPDIVASVHRRVGTATVPNPRYPGNGSISSLAAAIDCLSGDVLILNSDLVYERQMLQGLVSSDSDVALVVSRTRVGSPDVQLRLEGRRLEDIGRHIPARTSHASFCGASLIRESQVARFSRALEGSAARSLRTGWSIVFAGMAGEGVDIAAAEYEGPWWNINSVRDYTAAQRWAREETRSGRRT